MMALLTLLLSQYDGSAHSLLTLFSSSDHQRNFAALLDVLLVSLHERLFNYARSDLR